MEKVKAKVKELLDSGAISGFVGLKQKSGHPAPHLFTKENEGDLEQLVLGEARYPLNAVLMKIAAKNPDQTFGILVRGCDDRSLKELMKYHQLNPQKVVMIGIACSEELVNHCCCHLPYPSEIVSGEKKDGYKGADPLEKIDNMGLDERLDFWLEQFGKCMKCYGCRNICPLCYCEDCTLQDELLIPPGKIPPANPTFHLVRAYHLAGRCIDCGLCEEVCPANIPLRVIYKKLGGIVKELYDYMPGMDEKEESPLGFLGSEPYEGEAGL